MSIDVSLWLVLIFCLFIAYTAIKYLGCDGHKFFRGPKKIKVCGREYVAIDLTRRNTFDDVWSHVFWQYKHEWIKVHLDCGMQLVGKLVNFDEIDRTYILLEKITRVYKEGESKTDYFGKGKQLLLRMDRIVDIVLIGDDNER